MNTNLFSKINTWFKEVVMDKKRLFIIAGGVILVLIVATILLVSCNKKDGTEATAEAVVYPAWQYTTVVARCEYDRNTQDTVCTTRDGISTATNLLAAKGAEGWELVSVFGANNDGKTMSVFAFKRPANPD
jgi:hypothetical protein